MEIQKLLLAEDIFDQLFDYKIVTIRKGCRDIQLGKLIFESTEEKRTFEVDVFCVMYTKLLDVPTEFMFNNGFKSHDDMLEKMKSFYPDITLDSECTTVCFDTE